ncbi:transposase [Streptococcus mitis]|uniref:IS4 family transposase n=1 Tax=Streptococcus mitis TaxID=28037 RepID=UPI001CBF77B1|nr:transposase [Streptococcus mitis]MBZ2108068.1 transposase [Streptococcus mitis]MBZ2115300.1 transposase [Streptococcus mitis]
MSSLPQNHQLRNSISTFFKEISLNTLTGGALLVLFHFLLTSIFSNRSPYQLLKEVDNKPFSQKTFHNRLSNPKINWRSILFFISKKLIEKLRPLTSEERKTVFIVDDSIYPRARSKKVQLLSKQYDHANKVYVNGFRFLNLGWSDGNTFLPLAFSLLGGKKSTVGEIDKRTLSGKRKMEALEPATDVTLNLLKKALHQGIQADYVLFDSWFSSPKLFVAIRKLQLHVISMVKKSSKVYYNYEGQRLSVKQLYAMHSKRRGRSKYLLSLEVTACYDKTEIPLKLVFVRNRNKKNDFLVLASTDTSLSEEEIIQTYGKRWEIEVYFKICKQYLRLTRCQSLSYDELVGYTTGVCLAYSMLAYQHRFEVDGRSFGDLFFIMCKEIEDLSFKEALRLIFQLLMDKLEDLGILSEAVIEALVNLFLIQAPKILTKRLLCLE